MKYRFQRGDLVKNKKSINWRDQSALGIILVEIFSARNKPKHPCCGVPGFGIIWMDSPGDIYEFANEEYCETDKGFRLLAKSKDK